MTPGQEHLIDRVYSDRRQEVARRLSAAAPALVASRALALEEQPQAPHLDALRHSKPWFRGRGLTVVLAMAAVATTAALAVSSQPQRAATPAAAPATPAAASPPLSTPPPSSAQPAQPSTPSVVIKSPRAPVAGAVGSVGAAATTPIAASAGPSQGPYIGVFVAQSSLVATPHLVGLHPLRAVKTIRQLGLEPRQLNHPPRRRPALWVIAQSPRAGLGLEPRSVVSFRISTKRPWVKVPNVVGLGYAQAKLTLSGYGFRSYKGYHRSKKPNGQVVDQAPNGGRRLKAGAGVDVIVSSGPRGRNQAPPPHHTTPTGSAAGPGANGSTSEPGIPAAQSPGQAPPPGNGSGSPLPTLGLSPRPGVAASSASTAGSGTTAIATTTVGSTTKPVTSVVEQTSSTASNTAGSVVSTVTTAVPTPSPPSLPAPPPVPALPPLPSVP